jgi:hypothetical protein
MPRQTVDLRKTDPKASQRGFKVRSNNDLKLISLILDGDPALRERVLRFMELHLGKKELIKVGEDPK